MEWIPLRLQRPTAEDGDENGDVLWMWPNESSSSGYKTGVYRWSFKAWLSQPTHFARIKELRFAQPIVRVYVDGEEVIDCWVLQETGVQRLPVLGEWVRHAMYADESLFRSTSTNPQVAHHVLKLLAKPRGK